MTDNHAPVRGINEFKNTAQSVGRAGGKRRQAPNYISTTNACKLCKPMGAALAFRGIEGSMPFLHGSQGCATYMRRYIISHFNEPMDIASSSLGEKHAVFGGGPNLKLGLTNIIKKFHPRFIGIASTCLTETIGDDVPMLINEFIRENESASELPALVSVSTPSYSGTHMEGFHAAVKAVLKTLVEPGQGEDMINLLPGFLSPAEIRHLQEIVEDFGLRGVVLPDISETLDGPALAEHELIPRGGTKISAIRAMGRARATLEFGRTMADSDSGGSWLARHKGVENYRLGTPIGLRETDRFLAVLEQLSGITTPEKYLSERGRLLDSFTDGHKYVFGKRAVVYGEEDLVAGMTSFLAEIGVQPVLCASGGKSGKLQEAVSEVSHDLSLETPVVQEGTDFYDIAEQTEALKPDFIIGHSKGYHLARKLAIPMIRVGFPIHDRIGGQRLMHIGYRGAQNLFDLIANTLLDKKQSDSEIGYSYM
ncbi:MAG TPA: nitrogenase [Desulfobacterales bacterium]|nr:nitrogenase [Desulfobacterales bacterium]